MNSAEITNRALEVVSKVTDPRDLYGFMCKKRYNEIADKAIKDSFLNWFLPLKRDIDYAEAV